MLDIYLARLWPELYYEGSPKYWRRYSNGYNVRRVLDPSGVNRLEKKWALFKNEQRVWEVQALPDPYAMIVAAERYLKEANVV